MLIWVSALVIAIVTTGPANPGGTGEPDDPFRCWQSRSRAAR